MDNREVTPRVHLFDTLDTIKDDYTLMIVLPDGTKYQVKVGTMKAFIANAVDDKLKEIKDFIENKKLDKDMIIDTFSTERAINFGRPLNITSNAGIERTGKDGDIYIGKREFRAKIAGIWRTLQFER